MSEDFLDDLFDLGSDNDLKDTTRKFQKAPFGWVGGKAKSLPTLIPILKSHLCEKWIDVFGGSGVVSLNIPDRNLMVFNDAYSAIVDFYRCLREPEKCRKLIYLLGNLHHPLSREEWDRARATWCESEDPVERAAKWYYMIRCSVIAKGQCFGRATNGIPPLKIPRSLELFESIHWNISRFQLESLDFRLLMRDYDSEDALFYVDPPYVGTDPGIYNIKFKEKDLRDLLTIIGQIKGTVIMSGYDSPLINSMDYWTDHKTWFANVYAEPQAYHPENYKADKENVQTIGLSEEHLWIKEA